MFSLCFDDNFNATLDMGRKILDKPIWWSFRLLSVHEKRTIKKLQPRWQIAQQEIEKEIQVSLDICHTVLLKSPPYMSLRGRDQ